MAKKLNDLLAEYGRVRDGITELKAQEKEYNAQKRELEAQIAIRMQDEGLECLDKLDLKLAEGVVLGDEFIEGTRDRLRPVLQYLKPKNVLEELDEVSRLVVVDLPQQLFCDVGVLAAK